MPPAPIVAATSAICSGVASTLPWPIADEPTARSSPISRAARDRGARRALQARVLVEAELLGGLDELAPRRASRRAGRRRCCRSGRRRPAGEPPQDSPLAFWISTPSIVGAVWTGKRRGALGDLVVQHAGERDDLERAAGRLRRGLGDPGQREHLAGARGDGRDPAVAAGQRLDRGALELGVDARADGRRRARAPCGRARGRRRRGCRRGCRRGARRTRARGRSGRPARPRGTPRLASSCARSGGAGPIAAGDLARQRSEIGQAVRALGDRGAVAGLDRGALRQGRLAPELLAAAQAGVDELGAPVDAGVGVLALAGRERQRALERAEDAGLERDRDRPVVDPGARDDLLERDRFRCLRVGSLAAGRGSCGALASSLSSAYIARWSPRSQACAKALTVRRSAGTWLRAGDGSRDQRDQRGRGERGEAPGAGDSGQRRWMLRGRRYAREKSDRHRLGDRGRRRAAGPVRLGAGIRGGRAGAARLRGGCVGRARGSARLLLGGRAPVAVGAGVRPGGCADRGHGVRDRLRRDRVAITGAMRFAPG